ncbi:MAG: RNHCP domain-containing protein [Patescibacteria group bacterium]
MNVLTKKFQKRTEDFICEHCGEKIFGNGYTNHCPQCLWSKHVDIYPGDRANACEGLMEPISFELKNGKTVIHFVCSRCGIKKVNKTAKNDNPSLVAELSSRPFTTSK